MQALTTENYTVRNPSQINVVVGKNGAGKSKLLRALDAGLSSKHNNIGKIKYVPPERGGILSLEAGTEQNMASNTVWLTHARRTNQVPSFKQQSASLYRVLEILTARSIEDQLEKNEKPPYTFKHDVQKINSLLDNIQIDRSGQTFKVVAKANPAVEIPLHEISSGESELISLGIECLVFSKECIPDKENFLLLDEPNAHLHPDLQARFMRFLHELANDCHFKIIISTHSTAVLGSLPSYEDMRVAFIKAGETEINFEHVSELHERVLPIFGAHPLSNIFNQAPILIIEGEDDERIWQQAVRSSRGRIKLYPCVADSIQEMNSLEETAKKIINAVYDDARGYSLRDRDEMPEHIDDIPPIIRMRLSCRSAENLLLTDEALTNAGMSWNKLKDKIEIWLQVPENKEHKHYNDMAKFRDDGFNRKTHPIKEIRNDLMGLLESNKPWEVVVGQAIANLRWNEASADFQKEEGLLSYLGETVVRHLIPQSTESIRS